jgi:hypothetical protein
LGPEADSLSEFYITLGTTPEVNSRGNENSDGLQEQAPMKKRHLFKIFYLYNLIAMTITALA